MTNEMHQIHFQPGLCPGPHWGSSRRSPRPLVGWGGDTSRDGVSLQSLYKTYSRPLKFNQFKPPSRTVLYRTVKLVQSGFFSVQLCTDCAVVKILCSCKQKFVQL